MLGLGKWRLRLSKPKSAFPAARFAGRDASARLPACVDQHLDGAGKPQQFQSEQGAGVWVSRLGGSGGRTLSSGDLLDRSAS